jgi:hypothetical protein
VTIIDPSCHLLFSGIAEKICPHDIPGKDGITRENQIGGLPVFLVMDDRGDSRIDMHGSLENLLGRDPNAEGIR